MTVGYDLFQIGFVVFGLSLRVHIFVFYICAIDIHQIIYTDSTLSDIVSCTIIKSHCNLTFSYTQYH